MSDIIGPANAANAVTVRPAETRSFLALDTWFQDCSGPLADDGTSVEASWLNGMLAWSRSIWRGNGNRLDGITPVVPEVGTDDAGVLKAIQHLIQRGQVVFADDSSATVNVLVASLNPALVEYKKGLTVAITAATTNTGASTLNLNGLGAKAIVRPDGSTLLDSDIVTGSINTYRYDGTQFRLMGASLRPALARNLDLYVNGNTGNDANDGTVTRPTASIQAAYDIAAKYGPGPYTVTIHIADFASYAKVIGVRRATADIVFVGNTTTPSNVVVTNSASNAHCFHLQGPNTWTVQGVKVVNSGSGGAGGFVATNSGSSLNTSNTASGTIATGAVFEAYAGANVNVGSHVFSGSAGEFLWGMLGGVVQVNAGVTFTVSASVSVPGGVVLASFGGIVSFNPSNATWVNPGNVTGQKYTASLNGIINVNGAGVNYLPGTVAGFTATGGQYQ